MDLRKKESLSVEEIDSGNKKWCADCKTTKTPLWRVGPAGPKSLCNACGIRYRKKRRALMGMSKESEKKKKERVSRHGTNSSPSPPISSNTAETVDSDGTDIEESSKLSFMVLSKDLFIERLSFSVKKQRCQRRRKLGEEELAAVSLLALSCGSVFV